MSAPNTGSDINGRTPRAHKIMFEGTGRTKQEFKKECDINNIVRAMEDRGTVNHINPLPPAYGDFTNCDDYQTALHKIRFADDAFASMPSRVRERFRNNPSELIAFTSDPNNQEEALALGLIAPTPVPVTPPVTPPEPVVETPSPPIVGGE